MLLQSPERCALAREASLSALARAGSWATGYGFSACWESEVAGLSARRDGMYHVGRNDGGGQIFFLFV